jgi:hypothetical protein
MNAQPRYLTARCLSLVAAIAFSSFLACSATFAQEDPFGAAPKPAGDDAPAAPVGKKTATRPPPTVEREPLVIEMLRASNPSSPEQQLSAAQSALQFGRIDEAKKYLEKLLADKPADDALAPLTARYGPFLLQIIGFKDLQPAGLEAANLVQSAAQRVAQDQTRIATAIKQLSSSDAAARQSALEQLALGGDAVVNPLLAILADPARAAEHAALRLALVQLGSPVELPLIAALDSRDESLRTQVIAVLARMGSPHAAMFLVRPALDPASPKQTRELAHAALKRLQGATPDLYEGTHYLAGQVDRLLKGDLPFESDQNDRVTLWNWDESTRQVVSGKLPRSDAGLFLAARVSRDLLALKPDDQAVQRQMLLTNLELAKVLEGFDRPLSGSPGSPGAIALAAGPQVINQVLTDALNSHRTAAAQAAAELLGRLNDASVLHTTGGDSPLARALQSSDRRVRLTAVFSMLKLAPGEQFPGAGRIGETLAWFIATSGDNSVLIGNPRGEDAQTLVGYVNALGYEGEGAYTGRMLAERAFANPDFSCILISDAIDGPPVEELVQWLRRDYRTARMPLGVMARGERFLQLEQSFSDDRFTTVFPRIHSVEVCNSEISKLKAIAGRNFVNSDERIAQARAALSALELLAKRFKVFAQYDILRQEPAIIAAMNNPALAAPAASLLAYFPTPAAQQALVNFASQSNREFAARQAAAVAFTSSVQSHGLRIGKPQIAQQYSRYNASQTADKPTQELLSAILDTIESPAISQGDLVKQP